MRSLRIQHNFETRCDLKKSQEFECGFPSPATQDLLGNDGKPDFGVRIPSLEIYREDFSGRTEFGQTHRRRQLDRSTPQEVIRKTNKLQVSVGVLSVYRTSEFRSIRPDFQSTVRGKHVH
jgi:hypothetical protein